MTIFMIHSMWTTASIWDNYCSFFSSKGYNIKAMTLLHHGGASSELENIGITDYIEQAKAEVDKLDDKPVIIGHSMGGLIAQKLAEMGLARRLVLLAPATPRGIPTLVITLAFFAYSPIIAFSANTWDILLKRPFIIPFRNAAYGIMNTMPHTEQIKVYKDFVYESGLAVYEVIRGKVNVDENKVTCPVLVIAAEQDKLIPSEIVRRVANKYNAGYVEYPEHCHHSLVVGSGWKKVAGDICNWIGDGQRKETVNYAEVNLS